MARGQQSTGSAPAPIRLSGFSLDVLDSVAPAPNWQSEETLEKAVRRYLDDRTLRPPGWACLPLPENAPAAAEEHTVEIQLSDATVEEVAAEAATQGVSLEVLVTHAVMYAWAAEHPRNRAPTAASARPRRAGQAWRDDRSRT